METVPNLVFWTLLQTGKIVPKVEGEPGTGKTETIETFCKAINRKCHTLVASLLEPTDFAIPFVTEGKTKLSTPAWLERIKKDHNMENGTKWVLFLDEMTQCSPAQQTPVMRIIKDKKVGDDTIPDDVWICGACNPVYCAANGTEFEPPLANRMAHLLWEHDAELWARGMRSGSFDPPRFALLPDDWEKCIPFESQKIMAFLEVNPLIEMPKDTASRSKAWPSKRTWNMAGIAAGAMSAIKAEDSQKYKAIESCVGPGAGKEYSTWERNLDLPAPEEWLALARKARKTKIKFEPAIPDAPDKVMVLLSSLINSSSKYETDEGLIEPEHWKDLANCFAYIGSKQRYVEIAVAAAQELYYKAPSLDIMRNENSKFLERVVEIYAAIRS